MTTRTELEIVALIEEEEAVAYGINDAELSKQRALAIQYYLGEPFGNEVEGRSQVVSFDVQDTVESSLPQLIKIFTAGDQVVRFDPKGPEDEPAALQETDYINHLVMEKNNGFEVLYCWFKDALISKNGYVKAYAEKYTESEDETYEGLTDAQLQMLAQDSNVEVVEHEEYPDPEAEKAIAAQMQQMMQQGQPPMMQPPPVPNLHNVKIKVTEKRVKICIKNVAPESIMVSTDTPGLRLNESRFVQHREKTTIADLKEQGFRVPDDLFENSDFMEQEANARNLYSEQFNAINQDKIIAKDTYIKIDGKRIRYVVVGNRIIHEEETDFVPFACISPMLMPHRHIGRSYSDLTMDIQVIKSAILRGQLDNMYLMLNGRTGISDRVNLEDMLTTRPGGVVRVQGVPAENIFPFVQPPLPQQSFSLIEYLDSMKEKRTGVTAYNQGLDADSLNKTATGINAIMQAAAARLELVARVFAETGVKDLFLLVHRLVRMNYTKPDIVRLRGKWAEIDPRAWKNRSDMSIAVGLGTGNKDAQLMHIQTILTAQQPAKALGLATNQNIYNALIKLTQNAGFRNPEEFWTDPAGKPEPPPPMDPKVQVAQMEMQADQQKTQAMMQAEAQKFQAQTQIDAQAEERKAQLDMQKFQAQAEIDRRQSEQTMQQEQIRSQNDLIIEREKLQMQASLEKFKAELKAETDIKIAVIRAEMQARQQASKPQPQGATQ